MLNRGTPIRTIPSRRNRLRFGLHVSAVTILLLIGWLPNRLLAVDCNRNGREDHEEIEEELTPDCNGNGIPDECDVRPVNFRIVALECAAVRSPISFAVADFDEDGRPDFAVETAVGSLTFLWNEGAHTFESTTDQPDHVDGVFVVAGDWNGDGKIDATSYRDGQLVVSENLGGRNFEERRGVVELGFVPLAGKSADFDLDGRDELALIGPTQLTVLESLAIPPYVVVQEFEVGSGPRSLLLADVTGDGFVDILTGNQGQNVSLFTNLGNRLSLFGNPRSFFTGGECHALGSGDFDRDGDLDIVAGVGEPFRVSLVTLDNRGDSTLGLPVQHKVLLHTAPELEQQGQVIPGFAAADFDGDLDIDVAFRSGGNLEILRNRGDGTFLPAVITRDFEDGHGFAVGDWDGDSVLDFAGAVRSRNCLRIAPGRPSAHSSDCNSNGIPDECELAEGDCDGNGLPDDCELPTRDCDDNGVIDECQSDCNRNALPDACEILSGAAEDCNENGIPDDCDLELRLDLRHELIESEPAPRVYTAAGHGDLFGDDEHDDVIVVADTRSVRMYRNRGDGTLAPQQQSALQGGEFLGIRDLEGDGSPEPLFVSDTLGLLFVFSKNVNGLWLPDPIPLAIGEVSQLVDIDGDGDLDLVTASTSPAPNLRTLLQVSRRRFVEQEQLELFDLPQKLLPVRSGRRDGTNNVAVVQPTSVALFRGSRAGRLLPLPGVLIPTGIDRIDSVDLDNDGDDDFVSTGDEGRSFRVLWNAGSEGFQRGLVVDDPSGARLDYGLADLDGNGFRDIVLFRGSAAILLAEPIRNFGDANLRRGETVTIATRSHLVHAVGLDVNSDLKDDLLLLLRDDVGARDPHETKVILAHNLASPPIELDRNNNNIPDSCDPPPFHRGDVNADLQVGLSDAVYLLNHLFRSAAGPLCEDAADTDDNEALTLNDAVFVLRYAFQRGAAPPPPGPPNQPCGWDPEGDTLRCDAYPACNL